MGCSYSSRRIGTSASTIVGVKPAATPSTDAVMMVEPIDSEEHCKRAPVTAEEASCIYRGARDGRVLRKQTILKADHYPSSHNELLPEQISGAPNFRQPTDMPCFGTAAPTHDGLRAICQRVAPKKQLQPIVWCNLRQEPCVYIHGRPFSVKERDTPFKAMENKGIQLSDVEQAEVLLKLEVIDEARRFGGRLLVLDESPPGEGGLCAKGSLFSYWETNVNGASVWTPREMYEIVRLQEGYSLSYFRVPITDEQAPHEEDFDAIVHHMQNGHTNDANTVYVFNCALGRGRTTTGLTIACLTWRAIATDAQVSSWDLSSVRRLSGEPADYAWGEYAAVRTLTAMLPSGVDRKAFVDCVIDRCAHMQNLRADILPKKRDADNGALAAKKRDAALSTGRKYLERYLYLILFNGYVCRNVDQKSSQYRPPQRGSKGPVGFKQWLDEQQIGESLYPMLDGLTLE